MITNENGTIITGISKVARSIAYKNYIAILDKNGAVFQISEQDIKLLYNFIKNGDDEIQIDHDLTNFLINGK